MMVKLRLFVPLVFALALLAPAAHAVIYYDWNQTPGGAFCMPGDPENSWGVCVYKVHNPWFGQDPFEWTYATDDPESAYVQGGTVPPEDPIVNQVFRNRTQNNWTDWHCTLTNGTITAGSVKVYNESFGDNPLTNWNITYTANGFFAETISGSGTYVGPMGTLHVYFEYIGSGNVTFSQYPTTTSPIPEPASIVALMSGLVAMGFGIRRRK